nr:PTS sugar transporter subunit IIA [Clostridia bacterium]
MDIRRNRQKLLKYLYDENRYLTSKEIAAHLDLSPRSVRYLIEIINSDEEIIHSSNKGFKLDESYNFLYNYENTQNQPETAADRKKYIYEKLVITNRVEDIDDLLDRFSISMSLFNAEMQNWKKELSEYNLYLKTKKGTIYSIGKERDRQNFAMEIIKGELKNTAFSLENIQSFFQSVDLNELRQLVLDVFAEKQYYLDDYSLLTYILHLALQIELAQTVSDSENAADNFDKLELGALTIQPIVIDIIEEIAEKLMVRYPEVSFTKNDIYEASLLMATRLLPKSDSSHMVYSDIKQIVGTDIIDLYEAILAEINEIYSIDISSYRFMYRFSLHIKNLIYRLKNNIALKEGQFTDIKDHYPFLFTIAVHISYIILEHTGLTLPENEICYIALHVGAILEDKNVKGNRIVAAVLSQDYNDMGNKIADRLQKHFEDLYIPTIATGIDQITSSNIRHDMVISTYPIDTLQIPVVTIGPLMDKNDMNRIEERIRQIKERIHKNEIIENLERYFLSQICFFDQQFTSSEQIIDFICDSLFKMGLTQEDFKEGIYKHEEIAPSSYLNFVIAHTLSNNDKRTFISLLVNPKPVKWGENEVNIIFVISVNKKDRGKFKNIFDALTDVMFDEKVSRQILQAHNYQDFMNILSNYM